MTPEGDSIANRLNRIETRLAKIEEILASSRAEQEQDFIATQERCYEAWIDYLKRNPEAVEAHLSAHEMAALKASINASLPNDA